MTRLRVSWQNGDQTFDDTVRVHFGRSASCQVRLEAVSAEEALVMQAHDGRWVMLARPGAQVELDGEVLAIGDNREITTATNIWIEGVKISLIPEGSTPVADDPRPIPAVISPDLDESFFSHGRLELTLRTPEVAATPGEPASFILHARNLHPTQVLTASLRAASTEGDPRWISFEPVDGLPPGQLHLQPNGDAIDVGCRVDVPRTPQAHAGLYSFTVVATEGTDVEQVVAVGLRVSPFLDLVVEPPARRTTTAHGNRVADRKLTMRNNGNTAVDVYAPQLDDGERLIVNSKQSVGTIQPGERKQLTFELSLAEKPSFFTRVEHPFVLSGDVVGQNSGRSTWSFDGTYVRRPIMALWLLVAAFVVAALYLAAASGLKIFPFAERTASMPLVVGSDLDDAMRDIADNVPCKLVGDEVPDSLAERDEKLTCQLLVTRRVDSRSPNTVISANKGSGEKFEDLNNIVIELDVAASTGVCRVSNPGPLDLGEQTNISIAIRGATNFAFRYDLDDGRVIEGDDSIDVSFSAEGDKSVQVEWSSRTESGNAVCPTLTVLPARVVPSTLSGTALLEQLADLGIEASVAFRPDRALPANTVSFVDPPARTRVEPGEVVTVVISTGPRSRGYGAVLQRGELNVGVGGNVFGADGQFTGPQRDHLEELLQRSFSDPIDMSFVALTAAERFTAVQTGQVDVSLFDSRVGDDPTALLLLSVEGETVFIAVAGDLVTELRPNHERILVEDG